MCNRRLPAGSLETLSWPEKWGRGTVVQEPPVGAGARTPKDPRATPFTPRLGAGAHTPPGGAELGASRCHGDRLHGDQEPRLLSPEAHPACLLCSDAYSGLPGSQDAFRDRARTLPPRRGDGWKGKRLKLGGRRVGRMAGSSALEQHLEMPITITDAGLEA